MSVDLELATTQAWVTRRFRAMMVQTLPALPDAACREFDDPDLWHPERPNRRQEFKAIGICGHCPVKRSCLAYAQRAHPVSGIWGGTTLEMREFMRDQQIVIH